QPDGCFVAELDGVPVGTTMTAIFGDVAWAAMVLVDATVRGRGVGTALMQHALTFLDRQGVRSVPLAPPPLGQPIYEKPGFGVDFSPVRYAGTPSAAEDYPFEEIESAVRRASQDGWDEVCRLDQAITGTDRSKFLLPFLGEQPDALLVLMTGDQLDGY